MEADQLENGIILNLNSVIVGQIRQQCTVVAPQLSATTSMSRRCGYASNRRYTALQHDSHD